MTVISDQGTLTEVDRYRLMFLVCTALSFIYAIAAFILQLSHNAWWLTPTKALLVCALIAYGIFVLDYRSEHGDWVHRGNPTYLGVLMGLLGLALGVPAILWGKQSTTMEIAPWLLVGSVTYLLEALACALFIHRR